MLFGQGRAGRTSANVASQQVLSISRILRAIFSACAPLRHLWMLAPESLAGAGPAETVAAIPGRPHPAVQVRSKSAPAALPGPSVPFYRAALGRGDEAPPSPEGLEAALASAGPPPALSDFRPLRARRLMLALRGVTCKALIGHPEPIGL